MDKQKQNPVMYRQGDVLLVRVDSIPANAKSVKDKIIAHGESSNHCHRVTDDVDVLEDGGQKFLAVGPNGKLQHVQVSNPDTWTGEHHPIELPVGNYKVVQQVEYDPYERVIRDVQD